MTPLDLFNAWDAQCERDEALHDAYETEVLLDQLRAAHIAFVEADRMARAMRRARLRAAHVPVIQQVEEAH